MAERVLSRVGASATAAVVHAGRARVPTAARALSAIPHNITGASGLAPRPIPSPLMDARASKPAPAAAAQGSSAAATAARDAAAAASRDAVPPTGAPATATPDDVAPTPSGMVDVTDVIATPYGRPSHAYQCAVHVPASFQRRELGQLFYGLDKVCGDLSFVARCLCLLCGGVAFCCRWRLVITARVCVLRLPSLVCRWSLSRCARTPIWPTGRATFARSASC